MAPLDDRNKARLLRIGLGGLELLLSVSVIPRGAYLQHAASRTRMEWEGRWYRWLGSEHGQCTTWTVGFTTHSRVHFQVST